MLRFSGGRLLGLRSGLAIAIAAAALSMAPSAAQAAFTLQPCHGSATAGRGATFPALLHNGGFWGQGFDTGSDCAGVPGAPAHPTYNSAQPTRSAPRLAPQRPAAAPASGPAAAAPGAGQSATATRLSASARRMTRSRRPSWRGSMPALTPALRPVVNTPGVIHQLPWAAGANVLAVHIPEGCQLPAPGTTGAAGSRDHRVDELIGADDGSERRHSRDEHDAAVHPRQHD